MSPQSEAICSLFLESIYSYFAYNYSRFGDLVSKSKGGREQRVKGSVLVQADPPGVTCDHHVQTGCWAHQKVPTLSQGPHSITADSMTEISNDCATPVKGYNVFRIFLLIIQVFAILYSRRSFFKYIQNKRSLVYERDSIT